MVVQNNESLANIQFIVNFVWFTKMKNSNKRFYLNNEIQTLINSSILFTGFYDLN